MCHQVPAQIVTVTEREQDVGSELVRGLMTSKMMKAVQVMAGGPR